MDLIDFSSTPALLVGVVFAASALQAITGIGFGVIAGPMLLVSMGSTTAIQASIVLSFLIALILSPATLPLVNRALLKPLLVGVCLGSPVGALFFANLSIDNLKIIAAIVVLSMTIMSTGVLARYPIFQKDSTARRRIVGMVSGALNTTLAMPGPPIAAYTTAIRKDKSTVRATTLVSFLFAYPIAIAFQTVAVGVSEELLPLALTLALPTIGGALTGLVLVRFFAEVVFKWLTVGFLFVSVIALLS